MEPGDLPQVLDIERASFPDPWRPEHFLHELRRNPYSRCLCLRRSDGTVLGYACVWVVEEELWIQNLAIHPGWRRQGLGGRLLEGLLELGDREACRVARLDVRPSNHRALQLYRSRGFHVVGARPGYYGGREDGWVMARSLPARGDRPAAVPVEGDRER